MSSGLSLEPGGRHVLGDREIGELATGEPSAATLDRLRRVALSKHKLLIESIRRTSGDSGVAGFDAALSLFDRVQARSPAVAAATLGLPQVGGWARASRSPDFLLGLAVVAALRSRVDFDLALRPSGGMVLLPGLGALRPPADAREVRVRSGTSGATATAGRWSSPVPGGDEWTPVHRIRVESGGEVLDVALDGLDPHLDRFGAPPLRHGFVERAAWQRMLRQAWRVLVASDRAAAVRVARWLQVIVPLRAGAGGRPVSATSGWTPGAVALSLPTDPLALAETLVHEAQHGVLGVVEDAVPLVDLDADLLCYAPWRDDPRPVGGLLHGCYAHLAVTAFWRRRRENRADAERGHFEFARWRQATLGAVHTLLGSGALTATGARLASGMRDVLSAWEHEPVPARARERATRVNAEHQRRFLNTSS